MVFGSHGIWRMLLWSSYIHDSTIGAVVSPTQTPIIRPNQRFGWPAPSNRQSDDKQLQLKPAIRPTGHEPEAAWYADTAHGAINE